MKLITANKLNRFWQKGIKPIKNLLGNTDISKIGDGTVTGAINELNTGMPIFEKITVRVMTKANDFVKIEGAPTTGHYIPVIVSHSNISNCLDSVFWDGEWRISSDYAQYVTINFYKYPL